MGFFSENLAKYRVGTIVEDMHPREILDPPL